MITTPKIALVTGATQGLGLALVEGLAHRLNTQDTVYLTGRDPGRVAQAVEPLPGGGAQVRGAVLDEYAEVNNFGTTRILRAFAPLLQDNGRLIVVASSLGTLHYLAPVLHDRFDGLASLDEVDKQIAAWRDAVKDGSAWPGFINIPSKIGQVAAVRAFAHQRREQDTARGILLAAVCPGMMNTSTSAMWWDVSRAPSPAEAAVALLDLALEPVTPGHYGELVRNGEVLSWAPRG